MNKKIYIIISITLVIFIAMLAQKECKEEYILYNIDLTSNLNCITQREVLIKDEKVFIGNNKKELENGYFDIKIEKIDKGIKLQVNKLMKNYIKDQIYDKQYLRELFNYLNNQFKYSLSNEKFIEEVENIYLKLRTQIIENEYENIIFQDNNFNIKIYVLDYSIFIEIWRNDI